LATIIKRLRWLERLPEEVFDDGGVSLDTDRESSVNK
jgi:hypothetical protein